MLRANYILLFLCSSLMAQAQEDEFRKAFEGFQNQARANYDDFRSKANHQYAEFVKEAWKLYKVMPAIPKPKDEDKPLPIKNTVTSPIPESQPVPVAPIREETKPVESMVTFMVYGTEMKVPFILL